MSKKETRTNADLEFALQEQVELLKISCASFDAGKEIAGVQIATHLRTLLHDTPNSHALLEQLNLRKGFMVDTAKKMAPKEHEYLGNGRYVATIDLTKCALLGMVLHSDGANSSGKHVPRLDSPVNVKLAFNRWWNVNTVFSDMQMTRRDLVLCVTNTDGGAHVGPLDKKYADLSRRNHMGWWIAKEGQNQSQFQKFTGRPELACMRQIAFEVLETFKDRKAEFKVTV